jgi:predicted DNA-binding protein
MKNISISITDEQAERLKGVQLKTGAPISLQIRRALDLYADVLGKLQQADSLTISLKAVE